MLKRIVVGASLATASWVAYFQARRWWATWGVEAGEQTRALPGDEVVADGETLLTRGITIEAPPEAVWPWLVQMGFGRAGWYSYDRLDMKGRSADAIVPELQSLALGDVIATHPDGGFEVRELQPGRALVVYLDTKMVEGWKTKPAASISRTETPGLAMSGGFMDAASPTDFTVSWAWVLEPGGPARTRLIERVRGRFGPGDSKSRALMPVFGFGVFVMLRRQLLGIRDRVERAETKRVTVESKPEPTSPAIPPEKNGKKDVQAPATVIAAAG
jgi:hypothetical protein